MSPCVTITFHKIPSIPGLHGRFGSPTFVTSSAAVHRQSSFVESQRLLWIPFKSPSSHGMLGVTFWNNLPFPYFPKSLLGPAISPQSLPKSSPISWWNLGRSPSNFPPTRTSAVASASNVNSTARPSFVATAQRPPSAQRTVPGARGARGASSGNKAPGRERLAPWGKIPHFYKKSD